MSYLATYLKTIAERGNIDLAHSIEHTATEIGDKYIQDFNFCEHRIGLLLLHVSLLLVVVHGLNGPKNRLLQEKPGH